MFRITFLLLAAFLLSTALPNAHAENSEGDRLRELTKEVDSFNRLGGVPIEQRPEEAVRICVDNIRGTANLQIQWLKKVETSKVTEKVKKEHLFLAISRILKTRSTVTVIQETYRSLRIPAEVKLDIEKIDEITASIQKQISNSDTLSTQLNIQDLMSILKRLSSLE